MHIPEDLVDIQQIDPSILVELKYATLDNFTKKIIYSFHRCFLLRFVALSLSHVQKRMQLLGLGLKIWDGFRPLSAQWKLWEAFPDPRFVSDPRKSGRHTRGTAVDLTLVSQEGKELMMPSKFDDFSSKAHLRYTQADPEALYNRDLLQKMMQEGGFVGYEFEWWHFDHHLWQQCPPLDLEL